MAQETPSNLLYAQAIDAIRKATVAYSTNKNKAPNDISQTINEQLGKFANRAGKTTTDYVPLKKSEIPLSSVMNKKWTPIQFDVNLLQDQMDLLTASAVALHNYIKSDILQAQSDNLRLRNKIKTLELYSSADDDSLVYFGDTFITEDFIDWDKVSVSERATLLANGYMTLNLLEQKSALSTSSIIDISNNSNGFFGNNQEIKDAAQASTNSATGQKLYTFVGDTYKANNKRAMIDDTPSSWIEFEKYKITDEDRAAVKNLNLKYTLNPNNALTSHLTTANSTVSEQSGMSTIDWADGPSGDTLKLYFTVDIGGDQAVNVVGLLPYGLTDNVNNPLHVLRVMTSLNGTDWTTLTPENVWISNSIDKKISTINAENILIGNATWVTDGSIIRYVYFEVEQPKAINVDIGHQYYVSSAGVTTTAPTTTAVVNAGGDVIYNVNLPYNSPIPYSLTPAPGATVDSGYGDYALSSGVTVTPTATNVLAVTDAAYRVEGPLPPAENPQYYNGMSSILASGNIRKTEVLSGKRWAIGVRDIVIRSNVYNTTGTIVSKKFDIPGIIDRVALEADVIIPDGYDQATSWVKFYVSTDDGISWFQISRIQDDFAGTPEIIAFNDPTPTGLREPGVGYYDVKGTVNSLRFKAVITRPDTSQQSTPVLKSYKLKVIKRS